uniref:Uncharacterized protein n=1 Tax=Tobacco rattle virus (strain SYM) TaxID=12298 RepID=G0LXX3_TRVSY|nr:hypothetical protein [Tobacco rattle virus-SYM]
MLFGKDGSKTESSDTYEVTWDSAKFGGVVFSPVFGTSVIETVANKVKFKSNFLHSGNYTDTFLMFVAEHIVTVEHIAMYLDKRYDKRLLGYADEVFFGGAYTLSDVHFGNVSLQFQGDRIIVWNGGNCELELNDGEFMWIVGRTGSYLFGDWNWPSKIQHGKLGVKFTPRGSSFIDNGRVSAYF